MAATILQKIVLSKRQEIEATRAQTPLRELRAALADAPPPRDFYHALAVKPGQTERPIRLIAEVKKASPSAGVIREDFDPALIGQIYQEHGAACLSVLTDRPYFQGRLEYLRAAREKVTIPVLRKDFILDTYQLLESRVAGADAILLIAECLEDDALRRLHQESLELGMTPLVELYEYENLGRVLAAGATVVGVNNRNLHTFEVDLNHSLRLRRELPENAVFVSESGIRTRQDVERLEAAGVDAMLVGESLMRQADIGQAVDRLLNR
jgi:indole-3-glycerol phosphate synthase